MIRVLLLAILLFGCKQKISTAEGIIEVDSSYKKYVLSEEFIKEEIDTVSVSCYKCGVCFRVTKGSFGFSCICRGSKSVKSIYNTFKIVYEYRSKNKFKTYKSSPSLVKKVKKLLSEESCK